jgi:hypothetical protein
MKGNYGTNGILYNDIAAQTITEPGPCSTAGTRHSVVGFLGCSPNANFLI